MIDWLSSVEDSSSPPVHEKPYSANADKTDKTPLVGLVSTCTLGVFENDDLNDRIADLVEQTDFKRWWWSGSDFPKAGEVFFANNPTNAETATELLREWMHEYRIYCEKEAVLIGPIRSETPWDWLEQVERIATEHRKQFPQRRPRWR